MSNALDKFHLRFCLLAALAAAALLVTPAAEATHLCSKVNAIDGIYKKEIKAMESAVYNRTGLQGDTAYNQRLLMCNRRRDTNRKAIEKYRDNHLGSGKKVLDFKKDLPERVVHGHIRYYGAFPVEYGYLLSRKKGTWKVVMPVEFHFPKHKFPKKLDIAIALAEKLNIKNKCEKILKPVRNGVTVGKSRWACRVPRSLKVGGKKIVNLYMQYWRDELKKSWSRDGFEVDLLILNTATLSTARRNKVKKAAWPIRMNHNKNSRSTYHAVFTKPHPIYSGIDMVTAAHEFGHALGLDDEYPEAFYHPKKKEREKQKCNSAYRMCNQWSESTMSVYMWILSRRYAAGKK